MADSGSVSVLVVEDDDSVRSTLRRYLGTLGCEVRAVASIGEGREALAAAAVDLALVDYQLPDGTGDELIRWALDTGRARAACCMTARASCRNVVEAMRAGSFDVLEKPFHLERLATIVQTHRPASETDLHAWRLAVVPDLVGDDPAMADVLRIVHNVADTDCTVLIHGESGTGKELIARALHDSSPRKERPFVALNCAAIPESLIEAELFGHTRGAFTGAVSAREGCLVSANGGTLLLDEVGDMPLSAQAKLLRVLQERKVTPIGSDRPIAVDVRIIAATHRDLEIMVDEGQFRADLFFRLSVVRAELPPLRDRPSDIVPLAHHFLQQVNRRTHRSCSGFDESAEQALMRHLWAGNVRELSNTIERAVLLRGQGRITEKDLQLPRRTRPMLRAVTPPHGVPAVAAPMAMSQGYGVPVPLPMTEPSLSMYVDPPAPLLARSTDDSLNLKDALSGVERQLIQQALERSGGNRAEAAALLGLNRTTLIEKIRKLAV